MAGKHKKSDKAEATGSSLKTAAPAAAPGTGPAAKVRQLTRYFEDARTELDKVSWPVRKEVQATSLAVLALVVVMSIFLGLADLLLSKSMEAILSRMG
ncbi:MAG: preprotein translocase subunit SecE [Desulfovibrio sp.]|jgi:preprotein translocase subunit SecE|nr:preprotein translocase subunit SecE [Desulfovibrio sp.]